jgi:hypothetical protein
MGCESCGDTAAAADEIRGLDFAALCLRDGVGAVGASAGSRASTRLAAAVVTCSRRLCVICFLLSHSR